MGCLDDFGVTVCYGVSFSLLCCVRFLLYLLICFGDSD